MPSCVIAPGCLLLRVKHPRTFGAGALTLRQTVQERKHYPVSVFYEAFFAGPPLPPASGLLLGALSRGPYVCDILGPGAHFPRIAIRQAGTAGALRLVLWPKPWVWQAATRTLPSIAT